MFGVDKGDQIRAHGGGFATKAHFKKWYKKCLAVEEGAAFGVGQGTRSSLTASERPTQL